MIVAMRLLAVTVLLLVAAACAEAEPAPTGPQELRVALDYASSGALGVEGGVSYVRVDGDGYTTFGVEPQSWQSRWLPPGEYRVTAWSRSCEANCGNLGPPHGYCHTDVTLDRPRMTFVLVRGGECEIHGGDAWDFG
jgi:hypothetical protein